MKLAFDDRTVVCGAGGFIGGHLLGDLVRRGYTVFDLAVGFAALAALDVFQWVTSRRDFPEWLRPQPLWVRWSVYYTLVCLVVLLGKFSSQEFIYFQF